MVSLNEQQASCTWFEIVPPCRHDRAGMNMEPVTSLLPVVAIFHASPDASFNQKGLPDTDVMQLLVATPLLYMMHFLVEVNGT